MTDYEYLLLCVITIPVIAFMLGVLWSDAGKELEKEEKANE